jgi:hypothetical protein
MPGDSRKVMCTSTSAEHIAVPAQVTQFLLSQPGNGVSQV